MSQQMHYTRTQVLSFLNERFPAIDWAPVVEDMPPVIWRARWAKLADKHGLPYSRAYVQNLDAAGKGPSSFAA